MRSASAARSSASSASSRSSPPTPPARRARSPSAATGRAAIASRLAAEIYGSTSSPRTSRTRTHNTTRFVVLSREDDGRRQRRAMVITTFVFRVRNVPAALYKALGGFATNGVNMTKLES